MKIAESLRQAQESLTPETWLQGSYFGIRGDRLCYCAHGAVQKVVNPEVARILGSARASATGLAAAFSGLAAERASSCAAAIVISVAAHRHACRARASTAAEVAIDAAGAEAAGVALHDVEPQAVWKDRPEWVSENHHSYGSLDAHYLLGMAGLTASFNDDPKTTFQMVQEKFRLAIKLAETLDV